MSLLIKKIRNTHRFLVKLACPLFGNVGIEWVRVNTFIIYHVVERIDMSSAFAALVPTIGWTVNEVLRRKRYEYTINSSFPANRMRQNNNEWVIRIDLYIEYTCDYVHPFYGSTHLKCCPSMAPTAANAQQEPHFFCLFTLVT